MFTGESLPVWLVVLLVFPGLLVAHVGVLGLYPELSDETPRLAFAGGTVAAVTVGAVTVLFGWLLVSRVGPFPGGVVAPSPPGFVFLSVMSLLAVVFAMFGLATLRSAGRSTVTGLLVLGFAVPWVVILAVTPVYGADLPGWLALAVYGPMPVVLLALGVSLRGETPHLDPEESPGTLPSG